MCGKLFDVVPWKQVTSDYMQVLYTYNYKILCNLCLLFAKVIFPCYFYVTIIS